MGSFSYTSLAGSFFSFFFSFLNLGRFSYTSRAVLILMQDETSYTFRAGFQGSFSYTSRGDSLFFFFSFLVWVESHVGFLFCWIYFFFFFFFFFFFLFCLFCFSISFISRVGVIFIWRVFLKRPVLASFLCGELLVHIPS